MFRMFVSLAKHQRQRASDVRLLGLCARQSGWVNVLTAVGRVCWHSEEPRGGDMWSIQLGAHGDSGTERKRVEVGMCPS